MTYAARITALPLPEPICRDDTRHGVDYYTEDAVLDVQEQAASIAAHADTEIAALRARVAELERAGQAVVDRWDTPLWKDARHTADFIHDLRAAIHKESA